MELAIYLFSALTLLSALGVVFSAKPLTSALYLVLTLFLVAVHFALLDAGFLAVTQVLVYAGAIMVLVVFVIMLLGVDEVNEGRRNIPQFVVALAAVSVFVAIFAGLSYSAPLELKNVALPAGFGGIEAIGAKLFREYVLAFELASVLLLAAIVAAVTLTIEPKRALPEGRGLKAMHKTKNQGVIS